MLLCSVIAPPLPSSNAGWSALLVFTATVLDMSHEGFGRAIVLAGRLVVVADVLRDAQRFGFPTVEKLTAKGQTLVDKGAKLVAQYPEVARDDS